MRYKTKFKYEKTMENGSPKKVTEVYLVKADCCADAESNITNEMADMVSGEFEVKAVEQVDFSEIFRGDGDQWFEYKVAILTLDEKTGVEKKHITNILVQSTDFLQSYRNLEAGMKDSMSDWDVESVKRSSIIDVFD